MLCNVDDVILLEYHHNIESIIATNFYDATNNWGSIIPQNVQQCILRERRNAFAEHVPKRGLVDT